MVKGQTPSRPCRKIADKVKSRTDAHQNMTAALAILPDDEDMEHIVQSNPNEQILTHSEDLPYWSGKNSEDVIAEGAAALTIVEGPSCSTRKRTRSTSKPDSDLRFRSGEPVLVDDLVDVLKRVLTMSDIERSQTKIVLENNHWVFRFPHTSQSPEGKKTKDQAIQNPSKEGLSNPGEPGSSCPGQKDTVRSLNLRYLEKLIEGVSLLPKSPGGKPKVLKLTFLGITPNEAKDRLKNQTNFETFGQFLSFFIKGDCKKITALRPYIIPKSI